MTAWKARRFWTEVSVEESKHGYAVRLDGRPIRTPAKAEALVPTLTLAQALAEEWRAVDGEVSPRDMPVTRSVNAAIDKVTPQFDEVAKLIAAYGETDLLCYRAAAPDALCQRQAIGWDPLLDWAGKTFGARLSIACGVMPVAQSDQALSALRDRVAASSPFQLTALHDLVGLSGSLVLGLAVADGHLDPEHAWALSRIDEEFQAEQWGRDDEAEAAAAYKRGEFLHAARFHDLSTTRS